MRNNPYLAEHDWFLHGLGHQERFNALPERVRVSNAELAAI